jgi:hypothetical protein
VTRKECRECCFWEKDELCADCRGLLEESDHSDDDFWTRSGEMDWA